MNYRYFGRTGMHLSEIGFGAWAIGGDSYGSIDRADALRALASAEEFGCNFVDTAAVYGESESILGEFIKGRRDRWCIATKYSKQPEGLTRTAEMQLRRLGVETIDLYQLHWAPTHNEAALYDELDRLKRSGKVRAIGVSLHTGANIDQVLEHAVIDGIQVRFSLLDPLPYLRSLEAIRHAGVGVIVRSCLKEGLLTGKYSSDVSFTDPHDQRHTWSRQRIAETLAAVEQFRFLEQDCGAMLLGAARYPLAFAETSTVLMGTKSAAHVDVNFGQVPQAALAADTLAKIASVQRAQGLFPNALQRLLSKLKRRLTK